MKLLIPKEHGSWAILLIPYFIGVAITGDFSSRTVLGLVSLLLLFFSRQPLLLLLRNRDRHSTSSRGLWLSLLIPFIAGLGVFGWLMLKYQLWPLWLIAAIGVMIFFIYLYLLLQRKERSILGELTGISLLTLSSSAALAFARGRLTSQALLLWLVNACYFASSVFYIKMKIAIHTQQRENSTDKTSLPMTRQCLAYLAILLIIIGSLSFANWLPGLILLAFIPMVIHILWQIWVSKADLKIMREGWIQVGLSIVFALFVVISFRL